MARDEQRDQRHDREQRGGAAPAPDPVGHGVKPAAPGGDDT